MFPLRDTITYHGSIIATIGLIVLNVMAFFYQLTFGLAAQEAIFFVYGFIPARFFQAPLMELPTIITSMFLHGSFVHLLGNLWFIWVFGPAVEGRIGFFRFLFLYLVAGAAAAMVQGFYDPESTLPMIGASGAVSGILGSYLVLFPRARVLTIIPPFIFLMFWLPAPIYLGYWALLQFIYGVSEAPGVAWWAHVGGFILGLLLIPFMRPRRNYRADPFWECWRDYC